MSRSKKNTFRIFIFFYLSVLWIEAVYRFFALDPFMDRGLLYLAVFSLPIACVCTFLSTVWKKEKINRTAALICLGAVTFWMLVETVYATIFRTVMVVESLQMAGMALSNYWRETFSGIWKSLPQIILELLPMAVLIFCCSRKFRTGKHGKGPFIGPRGLKGSGLRLVLLTMFFIGLGELSTLLPSGGLMSVREMYRQSFDPTITVREFGMLTTLRLDLTQTFFGLEEPRDTAVFPVAEEPVPESDSKKEDQTSAQTENNPQSAADPSETAVDPVPEEPEIVYADNVMDIDFSALAESETDQNLKKTHEYFASRKATAQNEYTGMFEGYNLIYITAEGFWKYAVDKTHTPTLYKMANEGFVFNNFYCPLGTHSTCDGEFAATTGLVPSNQYTAFHETIGDNMYFCMGNQLRALGYPTTAYHAHYREYYRRDETHPNMGYDYYGIGQHGINIPMTWPESDLATMEFIWPKQQENFENAPWHLYFMTISGHLYYTWSGNYQSKVHKEEVADMNMSEEAEAYVACQMELDLAMEYLIEKLDEIGQLDKTLFVISGDHYPYGMEEATWNELAGHEVDQTFELAKSTLIIWSASMEKPIPVDKVCCSIDILPTVSNLMGVEYDSRLLMGRDILSDCEGVAVFYNKSFVTEYGSYDVKSNKFTANEGTSVSEDYVKNMYDYVSGLFTATDRILKSDYYRKLGLDHGIEPGKSCYYK